MEWRSTYIEADHDGEKVQVDYAEVTAAPPAGKTLIFRASMTLKDYPTGSGEDNTVEYYGQSAAEAIVTLMNHY